LILSAPAAASPVDDEILSILCLSHDTFALVPTPRATSHRPRFRNRFRNFFERFKHFSFCILEGGQVNYYLNCQA
jgi:hypothetical protein